MAVKTITIDIDAYERLKHHKREGESFSDVVKRMFKAPLDVDALRRDLEKISPAVLDAVEESINDRRKLKQKRRVA